MMTIENPASSEEKIEESAYSFAFISLKNNTKINLGDFKGKVLLIVNTASKCGLTPQYEALEALYQEYGPRGLVVIGVPSNDFGHQEPGTNEDIEIFCQRNYGVTFPMVQKEKVSGKNAHPFYQWAKKILGLKAVPQWNFHKYLVDRQGHLVDYFYSPTSPHAHRFKNAIEQALSKESPKDI